MVEMNPAEQNPFSFHSTLQDFTGLKIIGKGTFGKVYRALRIADNKEYAIKEMNLGTMNAKEREDALNEVRVLASMQTNPHTIRYYDAFFEKDRLLIVTELARGGDLSAKIKRAHDRNEPIDEDLIWSIFIQICHGLHALHSSKVIHRDIKAANIYLLDGKQVAIGDFGISKVLKFSNGMATTQIGTPYYMAPEIWCNQRYNDKCDLWALGVLLYELAALRYPFNGSSEASLKAAVLRGRFDPLPPAYSPDLRAMVSALLVVDARRRPDVAQLLQHPSVARRAATSGLPLYRAEPVGLLETIKPAGPRGAARRLPGPMYQAAGAVCHVLPAVAGARAAGGEVEGGSRPGGGKLDLPRAWSRDPVALPAGPLGVPAPICRLPPVRASAPAGPGCGGPGRDAWRGAAAAGGWRGGAGLDGGLGGWGRRA